MRVAIATCAFLAEGHPDEHLLAAELEGRGARCEFRVWSDEGVDWDSYDRVVVRSTWDYTQRLDEYLAWADRVGEGLENPAELLRWNSDKGYLVEFGDAGIPVVPTGLVRPGEPLPELEGEVVVKPAISAGARDTGRFGPATHAEARALVERIASRGDTAMVQPYLAGVDAVGETAIVFFRGSESHCLHKRAVLAPDEEAPLADGEIAAAEIMFDETLVTPGTATDAHRELATLVLSWVTERFGAPPLYARVDMLPGADGEPVLGELEAVEPRLYLDAAPGAPARLAEAILGG